MPSPGEAQQRQESEGRAGKGRPERRSQHRPGLPEFLPLEICPVSGGSGWCAGARCAPEPRDVDFSPPAPRTRGHKRQEKGHNLAPGRRQPAARAIPGLRSPGSTTSTPLVTAELHIRSAKFSKMLKRNKQEEKNSLKYIFVSSWCAAVGTGLPFSVARTVPAPGLGCGARSAQTEEGASSAGTRPAPRLSLVLRTHADARGRLLHSSWHNGSFQCRPGSARNPRATHGKHPLRAGSGRCTPAAGSKRREKWEDSPAAFLILAAQRRGPWQCPRRGQTPRSPAPRVRAARISCVGHSMRGSGQDAAGRWVHGQRGRLLCTSKPGSQVGTSLPPSVAHVPREVWQGASPGCFPQEKLWGGRSPINPTLSA